jgi:hypothetical protein
VSLVCVLTLFKAEYSQQGPDDSTSSFHVGIRVVVVVEVDKNSLKVSIMDFLMTNRHFANSNI